MIISTINHKIRVKLGMTCSEYVMLDYIYDLQQKGKKPAGDIVTRDLGFSRDEIENILKGLINKNLYQQGGVIAHKWKEQFNFGEEFLEFWEIFLKKGNRAKAIINYGKCRKIVDKDDLFAAAKKYILSKEGKERQFIMSAETWLNPKVKHWEDVIIIDSKNQTTYTGPKKELT